MALIDVIKNPKDFFDLDGRDDKTGKPLFVSQEIEDQNKGTTPQPAKSQATPAPATASASPAEKPGANARTLFEWYQSQGKKLPPISERAIEYQTFGLGSSNLYVGTAEQNILLLKALQGKPIDKPSARPAELETPKTPSSSATAQKPAAPATPSSVKVFTGLVSNGVLSSEQEFTPRPDNLIESQAELQDAINNNLAPFIQSLPNIIKYKVKVVPSIVDADGTRRSGSVQEIQIGTYKNGKPKLKRFTNKWAIMEFRVIDDKKQERKFRTLVLGPTDAVKFRPDNTELDIISAEIPKNSIVQDVQDISNVNAPVKVVGLPGAQTSLVIPPVGSTIYNSDGSIFGFGDGKEGYSAAWWNASGKRYE